MQITKKRYEVIMSNDVGKTFLVHNGRFDIKVKALVSMVGHKYGEFALTRKVVRKTKKKQKGKK